MFANSKNVVLNGGQYNNNNITLEGTVRNDGIGVLCKHSVPGATHDSGERFDPPKCDPDTRISIIQSLTAWVKNTQGSSSMLWLRGSAGVGKSALAQSLAELCATEAILAGTFFFSRTSPNPKRGEGRSLFPTIAYQLVSSFPHTRKFIEKAIEDNPSIFDRSLETQMQKLVVEPLSRVAKSPMQRFLRFFIRPPVRLIIIDGLDECSDRAIQCELLRVIGTSLQKIPFPFRFLIASRPEAHITRTFEVGLKAIPYSEIDLCKDFLASEDIRIFLRKSFKEMKETHTLRSYIPSSWPSEADISELVCRSSGQFIYASTVIKYIGSSKHRPTARLNVILGLSPRPVKDTPYVQLDALYIHILSCLEEISTALIILGVLFIPTEAGSTPTPATIDQLLFLKQGDVELILSDMLSVLTLEGPHQPIRILHTSLRDFLLDSSRSGEFYVDVGVSHAALARSYMRSASEATYDLDSMRHSWYPMINNLKKAVLTEELHRDLLNFKFDDILCRSYYRTRDLSSTIEFQGYVMHWVWSFLSCVEEVEAFKHSIDIYDHHIQTFDKHLKNQLVGYLSHVDLVDALSLLSIYEDGLSANAIYHCVPEILDSGVDPSTRQLLTVADETGLNIRSLCSKENLGHATGLIPGQHSYLVLLRRFLQDPERSGNYFVDDMKYARAAVRCIKAVCMGSSPSLKQGFQQNMEFGRIVSTTGSMTKMLTEIAYSECITALLPKSAITQDLIAQNQVLKNNLRHRKKGVVVPELVKQVKAYLQRGGISSIQTGITDNDPLDCVTSP